MLRAFPLGGACIFEGEDGLETAKEETSAAGTPADKTGRGALQNVPVDVDEAYMDEKDTFHLSMAKPLAYSHGRYYGMGEELGSFGYSVRKQEKGAKAGRKTSKSAEKAGGAGKVRKSADVNGGKKATTRPEQTRKANSQKSDGPRNDKKRQK